MAAIRLVTIIFIGIFLLTSLASLQSGMHYVEKIEFCEFCHEAKYVLYNEPGESLDYTHNAHNVSCIDCHKGPGMGGELEFKANIGKMLLFYITGTGLPPEPEDNIILDNKERCLKCHEDYQTLVTRRVISPHAGVENCTTCHLGHERGMPEDACAECHITPVTTLKKFGGKHLEKGCNFCHEQHGFIPQCSNCHGLFHGDEIIDCAECHTDAHAPNENAFKVTGVENDVCGACHADIQNKFEVYPTKHNNLDCSMCHSKHGAIPRCTNCHKAHDDTMTADDCQTCHVSAHQPTNIIFPESTLTSFCEGCHGEATYKMEESATKHSELPCAHCHTWHGQIPTCSSCHATPHGPEYADCGVNCHILAHNVWDMGSG